MSLPHPVLALRRASCAVLALFVASTFTGCATFKRIENYPSPEKSETVSVAAKPMSKMSELPIGAYYDEPRHIIVTGHQKGLCILCRSPAGCPTIASPTACAWPSAAL